MTDETSVVKPYYATEEAYKMGYKGFSEPDGEEPPEGWLDSFRDSATYANSVLPELRSMAGFWDNSGGTYTVEKKVAAVKPGCEEDTPAEAVLVSSREVFEALLSAWADGARDALNGEECDPSDDYW